MFLEDIFYVADRIYVSEEPTQLKRYVSTIEHTLGNTTRLPILIDFDTMPYNQIIDIAEGLSYYKAQSSLLSLTKTLKDCESSLKSTDGLISIKLSEVLSFISKALAEVRTAPQLALSSAPMASPGPSAAASSSSSASGSSAVPLTAIIAASPAAPSLPAPPRAATTASAKRMSAESSKRMSAESSSKPVLWHAFCTCDCPEQDLTQFWMSHDTENVDEAVRMLKESGHSKHIGGRISPVIR